MQNVMTKEAPVVCAEHLVAAPGSDWSFWRCVCLRSAGFPAEGIFKLSAPSELIQVADQVATAIHAAEAAKAQVLQQINAALDAVRADGQWNDKKIRNPLLDARSKVNAMGVPRSSPSVVAEAIGKYEAALQQVEITRREFNQIYSRLAEPASEAIREIAGSSRFREAVTWQNPAAVKTALDSLLRRPLNGAPRSSRDKQHEELVASYWQRYCIKNDTIGFFGPVGWGCYTPEVQHLEIEAHEPMVTVRKTYWETWAMEALGAAIERRYDVQPWIPPILMPFIRVGTTVLYHPVFGPSRITPKQAAVLRACDGRETAKQLVEKLLRLSGKQFASEQEAYDTLTELERKRFIFWTFNIPLGPYPERIMRAALQRIEDSDIRQSAIGLLDELESARSEIEGAAGDAEKLAAAFDNLDRVFTRITDLPSTRNQGQVYAGRTLVYEDCRRNVEVRLGPELLHSFCEPLSLLLLGARWLTMQVGEVYKNRISELHAELARSGGSTSVDAALLWAKMLPLFFEGAPELIGPVQEEFRKKWERILQLGPEHAPIQYSCAQLRQQILDEFPANRPGWIAARYSSPDIMIAAASADAIRRGDCLFVLGEVHVSKNTLDASLFVNQHPSPDDLLRAVEQDLGELNITPIGNKIGLPGSRVTPSLVPDSHFRLEYLQDAFAADRSKALPLYTLVIENKNGELVAKTRNGQFQLNCIDLVAQLLSLSVVDIFKIVAPRSHTPRISVDRLVIKRETWRFLPSEMLFAQNSKPSERFCQARMWAQAHGIPRFVFFKVPVERKPAYLDLDSPILVDIFCKMVRRTIDEHLPDSSIDISEMLPTTDQLWLTDAHGQRYTSELRFVAVDSGKFLQNRYFAPQCE